MQQQQPPPLHESPERPPQLQLCACRVGDVDMPRLSGLLQTTPPDCGADAGMCTFWPDSDPELASAMRSENTVLIRISGDGNLPNHRRQFAVVPLRYAVSTENQSELCGCALFSNRSTKSFRSSEELEAGRSWFDSMAAVLAIERDRTVLMQDRESSAKMDERASRQVLKQAKRVMLETRAIAEAKDTFLATMSHEIRTPLNGIIGMTEILSQLGLNEDQQECLEVVRHSGVQLMELITDILDYSKLAAKALTLESTPLDIVVIVEEAHDLVRLRAEEKNVTQTSFFDGNIPKLLGDPKRVKQIVANLLSNAVKFTDKGSVTTRVKWKSSRGILRIKVIDTGIGIPKRDRKRIFNAFSQLNPHSSQAHSGTGLGLGIVAQLVQLMGGSYSVRSRSREDGYQTENTGTTLTVELPMATLVDDGDVSTDSDDPGIGDGSIDGGGGVHGNVVSRGVSGFCKVLSDTHIFKLKSERVLVYEPDASQRLAILQIFLALEMVVVPTATVEELRMYLQNGADFFAIFIDAEGDNEDKVARVVGSFCRKCPDDSQTPVVKMLTVSQHAARTSRDAASAGGGDQAVSAAPRRLLKPVKRGKLYTILRTILEGEFPGNSPTLSTMHESPAMHADGGEGGSSGNVSTLPHLTDTSHPMTPHGPRSEGNCDSAAVPRSPPHIVTTDGRRRRNRKHQSKKNMEIKHRRGKYSAPVVIEPHKNVPPIKVSECSSTRYANCSDNACGTAPEPLSILVAEDNTPNQKVLLGFLAILAPGSHVDIARDGEEAVSMACGANTKYDVVLMDIKMPRMNGFDATRAIRSRLGDNCPQIVAVTATVFENDSKRCLDAGMNGYISKPVQLQELRALINVIRNQKQTK